jgi:hypothetical protein
MRFVASMAQVLRAWLRYRLVPFIISCDLGIPPECRQSGSNASGLVPITAHTVSFWEHSWLPGTAPLSRVTEPDYNFACRTALLSDWGWDHDRKATLLIAVSRHQITSVWPTIEDAPTISVPAETPHPSDWVRDAKASDCEMILHTPEAGLHTPKPLRLRKHPERGRYQPTFGMKRVFGNFNPGHFESDPKCTDLVVRPWNACR